MAFIILGISAILCRVPAVFSERLPEVWSPWMSTNGEFPPCRSFARWFQQPSAAARLWVFLLPV